MLLILIIGGTGYLYGGLIGAVLFKLVQDYLANVTPQYWQFWLGLVLVVIVLFGRERITQLDRRRCALGSSRGTRATGGVQRRLTAQLQRAMDHAGA